MKQKAKKQFPLQGQNSLNRKEHKKHRARSTREMENKSINWQNNYPKDKASVHPTTWGAAVEMQQSEMLGTLLD